MKEPVFLVVFSMKGEYYFRFLFDASYIPELLRDPEVKVSFIVKEDSSVVGDDKIITVLEEKARAEASRRGITVSGL